MTDIEKLANDLRGCAEKMEYLEDSNFRLRNRVDELKSTIVGAVENIRDCNEQGDGEGIDAVCNKLMEVANA